MRKAEVILELQPYIDVPISQGTALYSQACSNDSITINAWRDIWLGNMRANKEYFGSFAERSVGKLYKKHAYQPIICAGAGPSLKNNALDLKKKGDIPVISCLHNFHFLEDNDVPADYYVSLDAGDIVIKEIAEGGKRSLDEYWEMTKDRTLLAFIGSPPELTRKWKGEVLFFNCPVPDLSFEAEADKIEPFHLYESTGGNVLGACVHIAKSTFGGGPTILIGADFSFSYDYKFHSWDSQYDKDLGQYIYLTDIYGIRVKTWNSYYNFKCWFEWLAMSVPGIYINATEGGCLGSTPNGNLRYIIQEELKKVLWTFNMHEEMRACHENPLINEKKLLF